MWHSASARRRAGPGGRAAAASLNLSRGNWQSRRRGTTVRLSPTDPDPPAAFKLQCQPTVTRDSDS